jgi:hypothetical protein
MAQLAVLTASTLSVVLGGAAAAQTYVATDDPRYASEPTHKAVDGRIGALLGGSDVGDADGFSAGFSAALGYRMGDVTLRGLFDYYRVGDGAAEALDRKGRATRLGGALRYSFAHNSYDDSFLADFWGELGAGYEHVAWRHGGILDRPTAELAVGIDLGHQDDRGRIGERRHRIGFFMDVRSFVAKAPEMMNEVATCSGPCSEATKPSRTDVSMFFELGVHWGR